MNTTSKHHARYMRTVGWLAERLAISKARAYELCRSGQIPCLRIGRQVRVDEDTFEAWASRQIVSSPQIG